MSEIALIGVDWGSTHLRAFAFDASGQVVDRRASDSGALTLSSPQQFDAALTHVTGEWARQSAAAPLIACGMVGAKSGWREAGYLRLSANPGAAALGAGVVTVDTSLGRPLAIIPGVKSDEPDVMRGEETQLVGCGSRDGMIVLPGTHCKWVRMSDGRLESFATFYTGEMNALLRQHSSVGTLLKSAPDADDAAAFELGLNYARAGAASWLHDLFVMRASVVTGQRSEAFVSTVLAGWLLGCELTSALSMYPDTREVVLLAGETLVPWYVRAATAFGIACELQNAEQVTARGLWIIGQSVAATSA